jgi:hypothetical protein
VTGTSGPACDAPALVDQQYKRAGSTRIPRRRATTIERLMPLLLIWCVAACGPKGQLQVTYGDWELLPIGVPVDAAERSSVAQTLRQGQGPAVSLGDLVELRLITRRVAREGRAPAVVGDHDEGLGWVWIGFDGGRRTDLSAGIDYFAAALVGLRQGSVHTFASGPGSRVSYGAGVSLVLPFGDPVQYGSRKHLPRSKRDGTVYADRGAGEDVTFVEITRVCQGRAEQRLVTLHDDSPIRVAQDIGRSYETREPRWMYLREARWEGTCNDGRHASYRYGPIVVLPPPGKSRGLDVSELWEPWVKNAWKQVPIGVVVQ